MQHIITNSSSRCHHMVVLLGWAWPGEQEEEQGHSTAIRGEADFTILECCAVVHVNDESSGIYNHACPVHTSIYDSIPER